MKKFIATALVTGLTSVAVFAQGTISFVNLNAAQGLNAPIHMSDGQTKVSGPNFVAALYAGATAGSLSLVAGSQTALFSGGGAGYFSGPGVAIPGVAGGSAAFLEVVVWDTTLGGTTTAATADQAYAYWLAGSGANLGANVWGASFYNYNTHVENPFSVVTGNPSATPPGVPAVMVGLTSFSLAPAVPEPTSLALVGLGVAGLAFLRRRK